MIPSLPVPRPLLDRLAIALAVGAASFAVTTIQGVVREGYDPWQQAVSALSLGPGGWLQAVNLIAFGVAVLTTVGPWRQILAGGRGELAYPVLMTLIGLGFIGVGVFRQDPAPGYDPEHLALATPTAFGIAHLSIAGVAAISSVASLCVMAARLAGHSAWRHWPKYSVLTAVVVVVAVTVYGVWSIQPRGFAGTFERVAMLAPMLWTCVLLRRLYGGAPLMITPNAARHVDAALTAGSRSFPPAI